jgi:RNA polymerase sigma-70 factor (ECF subfamily)
MSAGTQVLDSVTEQQEVEAGPHEALLARARAGDRAAFAGLVRAHQRTVYSLALRMLGGRPDAEDLAQEVFLQLHQSLPGLASASHLMFWLRKVTLHRAIDRLRALRTHTAAPLTEVDRLISETPDADPLLSTRLAQLIGQLPSAPRAVLLLRYQEDLDPTQIARTLGMPVNTVKSHLKRSLSLLRERFGQGERTLSDSSPPVSHGSLE